MIIKKIMQRKLVFISFAVIIMMMNQQFLKAADNSVADSLISTGNKHYLNREFEEAIKCYQQVIELGYEAEELFYNLGNAFYKQSIVSILFKL